MNQTQAEQFIISLTNIGRREYMADHRDCAIYLKRLQFFLDLLGNPEKKIPHYIHVTGTSGKGSVCLMLDSILRSAGKTVGTLTSPHASVIQERWTVDGKLMPGRDFAEIVTEIKPKLDEYVRQSPYDMISYYEVMTAIALYYFAKKKVEWAILEVGCGGRYDSTNVIPRKDVAVITNVGLDHTELLGDTKEKIAYEKSGIIKRECVVFTAEKNKKVLHIIEREAKRLQVTCYRLQDTRLKDYKIERLRTLGQHQTINAQLCIQIAKHLKISDQAITLGLKRVKLPLRMEIVSRKPLIILDGAHNPDKMRTTVASVSPLLVGEGAGVRSHRTRGLHLIIGFSDNKDIKQMIRQLASLKPVSIACTRQTQNPFRKTANPRIIADQFKLALSERSESKGTKIEMFLDPKNALDWSLKQNKNSGLILSTGSIFLSGEIKSSKQI